MSDFDFSAAEVLPNLPNYFRPDQGEPLPAQLVGGTVVRIGGLAGQGQVEGGGLVIDYRPKGSRRVRRVVLAFNELGMWVQYQSAAQTDSGPPAAAAALPPGATVEFPPPAPESITLPMTPDRVMSLEAGMDVVFDDGPITITLRPAPPDAVAGGPP